MSRKTSKVQEIAHYNSRINECPILYSESMANFDVEHFIIHKPLICLKSDQELNYTVTQFFFIKFAEKNIKTLL